MASKRKGRGNGSMVMPFRSYKGSIPGDPAILPSSAIALQNRLIVREVLSYVNFQDLMKTSLVNWVWFLESRFWMPKRCNILLYTSAHSYTTRRRSLTTSRMLKLTQAIRARPDNFPCPRFQIDLDYVTNAANGRVLVNLFKALAPFAKHIRLGSDDSKLVLPPELVFPKLESLKFSTDGTNKSNYTKAISCFTEILKHAPSLQKVGICTCKTRASTYYVDLLVSSMDCPSARKIRQLELDGIYEGKHLVQLSGFALNLQILDPAGNLTRLNQSLKSLLESQSKSLEELSLYIYDSNLFSVLDPDRDNDITIAEFPTFPQMQKLRRLHLAGMQLSQQVAFPSVTINYAKQFPNLKELSLDGYNIDKYPLTPFLNSEIRQFEKLEELKLPKNFEDRSWILHSARIFPGVRKLSIYASRTIHISAYAEFGNVEELTIITSPFNFAYTADKMLTGYSTRHLKKNKLSRRSRQIFYNRVKPSEFLHKLRVLKVKEKTHMQPTLTDPTCRLVLMKLRSLKCLDLSETRTPRISKKMLDDMRAKFVVLFEDATIV